MSETNLAREKVNFAKRLHALLAGLQSAGGKDLFTVLPNTLGIQNPPDSVDPNWAAMRAFSLVSTMISDVEREIQESRMEPDQRVFHMEFLPGICRPLSPLIRVTIG